MESFAIRPAPIYDSGASLWNGMDPDAMGNGDYRTKPFWTDQWGEEDNAYWQLSLIDDWDRYDLSVLDDVPDIVHEQLSTNQRLSPMLIDRITGLLRGRLPIIRHQRNTTATRHMIGMTPIHGLDNRPRVKDSNRRTRPIFRTIRGRTIPASAWSDPLRRS